MNYFKTIVAIVLLAASNFASSDTTGKRPLTEEALSIPPQFIMDTYKNSPYSEKAIECMVMNLYHEARSEGFTGMFAVALVVMNRVQDDRYPDTVCGVVKQGQYKADGSPKLHRCHFSWWCDGKSDRMHDIQAFRDALTVARLVLTSSTSNGDRFILLDITEGSTHYHTTDVNPKWRNDRGMTKIGQFGSHIFYRWG